MLGLTTTACASFLRGSSLACRLSFSVLTQARQKQKWDLFAGVLVERLPVVSKTLSPLEQEFQDYLWQVEYEKSLKSNHELQHEREAAQAEIIKSGKVETDLEETSIKQTAQDLLDAYTEELKKFKPADRITVDDKTNNVTSTNRRLEETLYLLIEQSVGDRTHFLLPQGMRLDGETMRQTAERVLRELCGNSLEVRFYGNAPCGFYKYKYPASTLKEKDAVGAKVFFFRAALTQGKVDAKVAKHFQWLEKSDLGNKFPNAAYSESVQKFLL